jgi:hypothetical protein
MTNDVTPDSSSSKILARLNLPGVIAGPAGKAISRLIAGIADIGSAWLQGLAQQIGDSTAARSAVQRAIGDAAAKMAASDDPLVQRAVHAVVAKEYRHQKNKESVALKTIDILNNTNDQDPLTTPPDVDDDWLNVFERYAEAASSQRFQDFWARVLAGQIRKPGTFSLRTLRFISELDADTAQLFEKWAPSVINGDVIQTPPQVSGTNFVDLLRLEEAGLINFSSGTLIRRHTLRTRGQFAFRYKTHAVGIETTDATTLQYPAAPLTKIGREIYPNIHAEDSVENARQFANAVSKHKVGRIVYGTFLRTSGEIMSPIDLWVRPAQQKLPRKASGQVAGPRKR